MCNSSPISESKIGSILSNFAEDIDEYEIINLEKLQGWSSKHLYLIVSADENYILKAKSSDQITGYDNEVMVCEAFLRHNIPTRQPILTNSNQIFYLDGDYHWCLMTYIPGTSSHVEEYTETTVKTLAEHLEQYFVASINNSDFTNISLNIPTKPNPRAVLEKFLCEIPMLQALEIFKGHDIEDLYASIMSCYSKHLEQSKLNALIHNDINPRNILIDHNDRDVISLIDWDHVCYGDPLKDMSDAVAIFYDFMSFEKAQEYATLFYKSFSPEWLSKLERNVTDYAFFYYYTVSKWQAILFYLDLLNKYGDTYGERERFVNEMREIYQKWSDTITRCAQNI